MNVTIPAHSIAAVSARCKFCSRATFALVASNPQNVASAVLALFTMAALQLV